jgi:hypothetical protein
MTIQVLQSDIDTGKADDCGYCPVALAIRRATGCSRCVVTWRAIKIECGDRKVLLDTPTSVQAFLPEFDDGQPVWPFEFELEVPCE